MEATTPYKVKRQVAQSYYISTDKYSWAYFYITATGELFIHSDWGYFCYSWKSFGEDFKRFIVSCNADYILNALERNYRELKGARAKLAANQAEALKVLIDCFREELKKERSNEDAEWVTMQGVKANLRQIEYKVEGATGNGGLYPDKPDVEKPESIPGTADFRFRFIIPFYDAGGTEAMLGWFQVWAMDGKEAIIEGTLYSPPKHRDLISAIRFDQWAYQVEVDDIFGGDLPFREITQQAYNQYLKQKSA